MSMDDFRLAEHRAFSMPEEDWNRARQQAEVIFSLAAVGPVTA